MSNAFAHLQDCKSTVFLPGYPGTRVPGPTAHGQKMAILVLLLPGENSCISRAGTDAAQHALPAIITILTVHWVDGYCNQKDALGIPTG